MYPRTVRCVLFTAGLRFSLPHGRELIVGRKGRGEEGVIAQYMHEPGSTSVLRLWYPDSGRPVHQPETCHHLCGGGAQGTAHSSEHALLTSSSVLLTVWLWSCTIPGAWLWTAIQQGAVQWNLSNKDTLGTKIIVLISEVSLFQESLCKVGTQSSVLIIQVVLVSEVSFRRGSTVTPVVE